jgi:hypothetical protein
MVFLGLTGHGKSWWLINLGRRALLHHKKVVHVTLELSKFEIQMRYFQSMMALPAWERELTTSVTRLQLRDDRLVGFDREQITAPCSMQQPDRQRLKEFAARTPFLNNLRISQFPTRGLTVAQLSGYLNSLEATGLLPDLLIVDYAALMQCDADNYRIALGRCWKTCARSPLSAISPL